MPYFAHTLISVKVHEIDRELHEEGMNRLAGGDPQSFTWRETVMLEQAGTALGAGVGHFRPGGQHGIAGLIADADFQA